MDVPITPIGNLYIDQNRLVYLPNKVPIFGRRHYTICITKQYIAINLCNMAPFVKGNLLHVEYLCVHGMQIIGLIRRAKRF